MIAIDRGMRLSNGGNLMGMMDGSGVESDGDGGLMLRGTDLYGGLRC